MAPSDDEPRDRVAEGPDDELAFRAKELALEAAGDHAGLVGLYEVRAEAVAEPLVRARALARVAELREHLGSVDKALRAATAALELDPRQPVAAEAIGRLYGTLREPHRHLDALTKWRRNLDEVGASDVERAHAELLLARATAGVPGRLERSFEHHRAAVAFDASLEPTLDESIARAERGRRVHDVRALLESAVAAARVPERKLTRLRALAAARAALPVDLDGIIEALDAAALLAPDDEALLEKRIARRLERAKRTKGRDGEREDKAVAAALEVRRARMTEGTASRDALRRALALDPDGEAAAVLDGLGEALLEDSDRAALDRCLERKVADAAGTQDEIPLRLALSARHVAAGRKEPAFDVLAPVLPAATQRELLARAYGLALAAERLDDAVVLAERLHADDGAAKLAALEGVLGRAEARGDIDRMATVATKLLALRDLHPRALEALEAAYRTRDDHIALRALLERRAGAAATPTEKRHTLLALRDHLHDRMGDLHGALAVHQRLAELDPFDADVRAELKRRLREAGRVTALADVLRWEVAHLETLAERSGAKDELLALSAASPFDTALLVGALRTYRKADPADGPTREALLRLLLDRGESADAAALLDEAVRAAQDDTARLEALARLADVFEHGLRDDAQAFATTLHLLDLAPGDASAVARLERIAERSEDRDRHVVALTHRARIATGTERTQVHLRLAEMHEVEPADVEAAIAAYQAARASATRCPAAEAALLRLYREHQRHGALADLHADLAALANDDETRISHLKDRARYLLGPLADPEGAAACLREVRAVREDVESLDALIEHARTTDDVDTLASLIETRTGLPLEPADDTELRMERATLLLDRLDRPRDAERELGTVHERDPNFAPALARLASLYQDEGEHSKLAEVSEAHLALATASGQRAMLAERLVRLYEQSVLDDAKALAAARAWVDAAPRELPALRALADHLAPEAAPDALADVLDRRVQVLVAKEPGLEAREEALSCLLEVAQLAARALADEARAEARLVRALDLAHTDPVDLDRLLDVAAELDRERDDARFLRACAVALARKATAVAPAAKPALFLRAADLFGGPLADAPYAFEVMRRAIVECPDDGEVLHTLVEYGSAGDFEEALERVLGERFDAAVDAATARNLQRERANLLFSMGRYDDAADAYQRLSTMLPDDERVAARHREALHRAGRHDDLVVALGTALRRRGSAQSPERTALLRELARTWDGLDDRSEALDAWKALLASAPSDPEGLAAVERLAAQRVADRGAGAPRPSVPPPASTPSGLPPVPRVPARTSIPPPPPLGTIGHTEPLPVDDLIEDET